MLIFTNIDLWIIWWIFWKSSISNFVKYSNCSKRKINFKLEKSIANCIPKICNYPLFYCAGKVVGGAMIRFPTIALVKKYFNERELSTSMWLTLYSLDYQSWSSRYPVITMLVIEVFPCSYPYCLLPPLSSSLGASSVACRAQSIPGNAVCVGGDVRESRVWRWRWF